MDRIKEILSAFSEEIRLRMVLILRDSALCVKCLVRIFDMPQPTVSRHLALLRKSGLVKTRREGLHCYYTFDGGGPMGLLKQRLSEAYYIALKDVRPFRTDQERLRKVENNCDAECEVHIIESCTKMSSLVIPAKAGTQSRK